MSLMLIVGTFVKEGWSDEAFRDEAFQDEAFTADGGDFDPTGLKFVPEGRRMRTPGGGLDGGFGGGGSASLPSTPRDNFEERKNKRRKEIEAKQLAAKLAREKVHSRVRTRFQ